MAKLSALEFYRGLLKANNIIEKEGTHALFFKQNDASPVTVEGKTLCLPTDFVLDNYTKDPDALQVFHPSAENVLCKDSPVFNFLKRLYRTSLTVYFELLAHDLVAFTNSPELSEKANKKQRKHITQLTDIDLKTVENLRSFFNKIDPNGDNKVIDFTVFRGRKIKGTDYNRVVVTKFPLLEELVNNPSKPYGVKIRKKDVETLIELHEVLFDTTPDDLEKDPFETVNSPLSHGTNAAHAPNFVGLTEVFVKHLDRLYGISKDFGDKIHGIGEVDLDWTVGLESIEVYRRTLLSFPGNDGEQTEQHRKKLEEKPRVKVSPLGTRREVKKDDPKPEKAKPRSYTELRQQALDQYQEEVRSSRGRYGIDGLDVSHRRRGGDIDVSDIDDSYQPELDRRCDTRRDSRYGESTQRRGYLNYLAEQEDRRYAEVRRQGRNRYYR